MPDFFCCEQDVLGGNGILLWWTQLRAHRPRGAVPPECSPWDGQVRASKQRGFILMCAVLWLTVGACVGVYRYLIQGLDWIDARYAGMSSWDQRLPPPAAKTAVQTLTVIVITAEQAGRQNHENELPWHLGWWSAHDLCKIYVSVHITWDFDVAFCFSFSQAEVSSVLCVCWSLRSSKRLEKCLANTFSTQDVYCHGWTR